jgi:hypothetical protein
MEGKGIKKRRKTSWGQERKGKEGERRDKGKEEEKKSKQEEETWLEKRMIPDSDDHRYGKAGESDNKEAKVCVCDWELHAAIAWCCCSRCFHCPTSRRKWKAGREGKKLRCSSHVLMVACSAATAS